MYGHKESYKDLNLKILTSECVCVCVYKLVIALTQDKNNVGDD